MDQDIRTDKGSMGSEEIEGRGKTQGSVGVHRWRPVPLTHNQESTPKREGQDTGSWWQDKPSGGPSRKGPYRETQDRQGHKERGDGCWGQW